MVMFVVFTCFDLGLLHVVPNIHNYTYIYIYMYINSFLDFRFLMILSLMFSLY